jgi:hypothetical protein
MNKTDLYMVSIDMQCSSYNYQPTSDIRLVNSRGGVNFEIEDILCEYLSVSECDRTLTRYRRRPTNTIYTRFHADENMDTAVCAATIIQSPFHPATVILMSMIMLLFTS